MNTQPIILVVDDEEPIRKLLKARFEREGFTVMTAAHAEEAEQCLNQNASIGVVVSDVKMPGKDGLTFTKEVKSSNQSIKVIVMTGHGEKSTAIQALRIGASDYLEKPFDLEEMTHAVKRTLKEYSLEEENAQFNQSVVQMTTSVRNQALEPIDSWTDVENTSSYTVLKKKWSEAFEKEYLTGVLSKHHGNVTAAAKEAAVDRSNFLRLLRRHHIDASVYRNSKKAA
jgi:DNA-binding NtrC family response regulator